MSGFQSNQSESFKRAVAALQQLQREEGQDAALRAFAEVTAHPRKAAFGRSNGLRERRGHVCLLRLQGMLCAGESCLSGLVLPQRDHLSEWERNGETAVIVAQPYALGYEGLRDLVSFCEIQELQASISAVDAWHFPGRSLCIQYRRNPDVER